ERVMRAVWRAAPDPDVIGAGHGEVHAIIGPGAKPDEQVGRVAVEAAEAVLWEQVRHDGHDCEAVAGVTAADRGGRVGSSRGPRLETGLLFHVVKMLRFDGDDVLRATGYIG